MKTFVSDMYMDKIFINSKIFNLKFRKRFSTQNRFKNKTKKEFFVYVLFK